MNIFRAIRRLPSQNLLEFTIILPEKHQMKVLMILSVANSKRTMAGANEIYRK